MNIVAGCASELPVAVLFDMARYRYEVFVQRLGWPLQTQGRMELDQFDRRDTLYVVARNPRGEVVGTARLLPTHRPYLLAEVFPQLLGDMPAPHSPRTWELSRFAFLNLEDNASAAPGAPQGLQALDFLRIVMRIAAEAGASDLVSVSPLGIERILRRGGIAFGRAAPPARVGSQMLCACTIALPDPMVLRLRRTGGPARPVRAARRWARSSAKEDGVAH